MKIKTASGMLFPDIDPMTQKKSIPTVKCPFCHALPGKLCKTTKGYFNKNHNSHIGRVEKQHRLLEVRRASEFRKEENRVMSEISLDYYGAI
jgi:hypothetical protein